MPSDRESHWAGTIGRREAIESMVATSAALVLGGREDWTAVPVRSSSMNVTCVIRYQIDPFQREAAIGRREALRGIGTMSATLAIGGDRDQPRGTMSLSNDVLPTTELRHGAYICVGVPRDRRALVEAPVEVLARRMGFQSDFEARDARRDRSGADIEQDAQAQGRCRHAGHHTAG